MKKIVKPRTPKATEAAPLSKMALTKRFVSRLLAIAVVTWLHLFVVVKIQQNLPSNSVVSGVLTFISLAVAPAALAFFYPKTLRRTWHRWPAIWILSLISIIPTPVLLVGEIWGLYRTIHLDSAGDRGPAFRLFDRASMIVSRQPAQ